jgi:hypothetical protein
VGGRAATDDLVFDLEIEKMVATGGWPDEGPLAPQVSDAQLTPRGGPRLEISGSNLKMK